MKEITLYDVIKEVHSWIEIIKTNYETKMKIEVILNSDIAYRVIFETNYNIAELVVHKSDFAPYRFCSFMILDVNKDVGSELIYCWYDDETHSIEDIISNLNKGIEVMIEY